MVKFSISNPRQSKLTQASSPPILFPPGGGELFKKNPKVWNRNSLVLIFKKTVFSASHSTFLMSRIYFFNCQAFP